MTQQSDPNHRTRDEVRRLSVELGLKLNLNRILVPLNGDPEAEQILPYASMLADWFSGEITLFHYLPATHPARGARPGQVQYPDAPHDRGTALASAYLEEIVSRLGPLGVKSRWGIATGRAATMITSRSVTSSSGIIAVGTTARSRYHRLFSTGLLDDLWKLSAVPLLIVNPNSEAAKEVLPQAPTKVIVPSGSGNIDSAISMANAIAGASRSEVTIALSGSSADEEESEQLNAFSRAGIKAEIARSDLKPTEHLHSIQAANPGSWIVIESKMRSGFVRSLFGSNGDKCVRDASGPVLVVPNQEVSHRKFLSTHDGIRNRPSSE